MQKLDSFNKILLATANINYLASAISGPANDLKHSKSENLKEISTEHFAFLDQVAEDLKPIMEAMGNYLTNHDAVCPLDQYVTTPGYMVVLHGKDDLEADFEDEKYMSIKQ